MRKQEEEILNLYIQKLTNNLSSEDNLYVHEMLGKNDAFSKAWAELEEHATKINAKDFLDKIDTFKALLDLKLKGIK